MFPFVLGTRGFEGFGRRRPDPPAGVRLTNGGSDAPADALDRVTAAILRRRADRAEIAATFPLERIRKAVERQADSHVHGKIVITL